MKKSDLLNYIESTGIHPNKQLGQNFMVDPNFLEFIVRSADPKASDFILEVGPGFGALTKPLIASGATVTSIEFDRKIAAHLRENFIFDNFQLIEADACKVNLEELIPHDREFRIIANLPYAISSPFIGHVVDMQRLPEDMLFLLQKETAQRLAASVETKNYSALSVRVQAVYDVESVRIVPPQVFYPPPDVESSLVRFSIKESIPDYEQRLLLGKIAKAVFLQRRKKMQKQLTRLFDPELVKKVYSILKWDENIRAEKISVDDFLSLTQYIALEQ